MIHPKRPMRRMCFLALPLFSAVAHAGYQFEDGNLKGELTLSAGMAAIDSHNANFGLGRIDLSTGEIGSQKNTWQEYYVKPGATLDYAVNPDFSVLAGGSFVASSTQGGGDPGGFTRDGDGSSAIEEAFAGFRAGEWKVTAGRQNYMVGNGFIVMDGNLDMFGEGDYWSAPRTAFRDSAIVGWQHEKASAQAFSLRTDDHLGDVRMSGANVDYSVPDIATLGAMAFKVKSLDDSLNEAVPRDGMQVYNLRMLNAKVPGVSALTLNGEYAVERGSGKGTTYDSDAWYLGGDYSFATLPMQPTFGYRYASFSGDPNLSDNKREDWDPLSKGFIEWGTWLIGDVVGNYLLYNSNEDVHTWRIKGHVTETVAVGALYYQFSLNEKNYQGSAVDSKRFADETALYVEWLPTPQIYTSLAYNFVKPQAAAKQALGNDNFDALELYVTYRY